MTDLQLHQPAEKPRSPIRVRTQIGGVTFADVLRAVQGDETRSYALGRYRAAGHSVDAFGTGSKGGHRAAREAMADALSRTEDWLEVDERRAGRDQRQAERLAIRDVRRRLELELWP